MANEVSVYQHPGALAYDVDIKGAFTFDNVGFLDFLGWRELKNVYVLSR